MTERVRGGVGYAPHRRVAGRGRLRRAASRSQERLAVGAYRAASGLLGRVPSAISVPAARALFLAAYAAWPRKRRIILANSAHVLRRPTEDPAVAALARRVYAIYARYVVELMRMPSRPAHETSQQVRAEGEHGMDSFAATFEHLRSEGRGMIAVSGHLGNIEALVAAFAARGLPTYALADDSAYPELYELLSEQRRRWGVEVIAWRNLREIYRALREPAILGLLVDWGYRSDDIPVRLFGAWTTLPAGPALLAGRTGAAIVPVAARRVGDGRFEARHYPLIEVPDTSDAAVARGTQQVADALEAMISAAPEQWYCFKPMWPSSDAEQAELEARWTRMASGERRRRSRER